MQSHLSHGNAEGFVGETIALSAAHSTATTNNRPPCKPTRASPLGRASSRAEMRVVFGVRASPYRRTDPRSTSAPANAPCAPRMASKLSCGDAAGLTGERIELSRQGERTEDPYSLQPFFELASGRAFRQNGAQPAPIPRGHESECHTVPILARLSRAARPASILSPRYFAAQTTAQVGDRGLCGRVCQRGQA